MASEQTSVKKKHNILLLTNRDSDNVGDQVIEACDIALVKAVMKNLDLDETEYKVSSHAASLVPKIYMETREEKYLKKAHELIQKADIVVFGGAPVFNYLYQTFYERTAITLELAQQYGKPVIFSAIGVERYEEQNAKCQRLKKTLNFECVKQITTRDGIEELSKYKDNEQMVIDRVADPAVFSKQVFRNYIVKEERTKKNIGVFIFRANGFKDNKIDFTKDDAIKLWKDIIRELEGKGYDYTLLTSGHFGDESFMDYLIRNHGIEENKCVFNINSPERLLEKISSFDGVISCRLHPSIISFSLEVPSVGLIWNSKVKHFYECIGYSERSIDVTETDVCGIVNKLEEAMQQGVDKNKDYLMTVYRYLFFGIKNALNLQENEAQPYDYSTLVENIPAFAGTSVNEQGLKLKRKFRRAYEMLNKRMDKNDVLKQEIQELQKLKDISTPYMMHYHSKEKGENIVPIDNWEDIVAGKMKRLSSEALECAVQEKVKNDGTAIFADNLYQNGTKKFVGWNLRFRVGKIWFWYLEDGTFCQKSIHDKKTNKKIKVFLPGENIPAISLMGVDSVVAEAQWKAKSGWRF